MRKEDFLEILKDYLKNDFSEDEVIDILRDYEGRTNLNISISTEKEL